MTSHQDLVGESLVDLDYEVKTNAQQQQHGQQQQSQQRLHQQQHRHRQHPHQHQHQHHQSQALQQLNVQAHQQHAASLGYGNVSAWFALDQATQRNAAIAALDASTLFQQTSAAEAASIMAADWQFQQPPQQLQYTGHHDPLNTAFNMPLEASPIDFMPSSMPVSQSAHLEQSLTLENPFMPMSAPLDMPFNWDFQNDLIAMQNSLSDVSYASQNLIGSSSPTDTYLEERSLNSSSSDNGWSIIDNHHHSYESGFFINPSQISNSHTRTLSESTCSDHDHSHSYGSWVNVSPGIMHSPSGDSALEFDATAVTRRVSCDSASQSSAAVSPVAIVRPIPVPSAKKASSPIRSPTSQSSTSPTGRKASRKSPVASKASETKIRKQSQMSKPENTEKRVGKRKGPLKPDQRKQASEIRKLRACLRCKFLKKTCDKGEPCAGCQPSHARLWQVPCTRIDIKEIGYFMKDWRADYERHATLGFSIPNIKGFSNQERIVFITHGYGHMLPVHAREVYVHDEDCFGVNWVESANGNNENFLDFEMSTAKLSAGMEGISTAMLSEYLDLHIDGEGTFENFIDMFFEGTPFLTDMLKTAYRFYVNTQMPVIRKALKLVLAYNLTMHITMVEGLGEEDEMLGRVTDEGSRFMGKTMAPVMINFQIKCAMADMWRELQKDVLEELSALYSSVYSGDKLKNWPTIFMLASILLAVWEEMQFDCHYREPDEAAVNKFCNDMETTPVGVIVGLFQAISQKLPAFTEWDTSKHHHLLASNVNVCNAMTEVRGHVERHGKQ